MQLAAGFFSCPSSGSLGGLTLACGRSIGYVALHSLLQLKIVVLSTRSLIALVPCSWLSCSNSPIIFFWAAVWKINAK